MVGRCFFALDLTSSDKEAIDNWRDLNLPLSFKAVEKNNFHITLAFLGNISSIQKEALINHASHFAAQSRKQNISNLEFNAISYFKKPKVLYGKISYSPPWLTHLVLNIENAAKAQQIFQEIRTYRPHITLYRKATFLPENIPDISLIINIKSFSLYLSNSTKKGVVYLPLNTWSLTR